MVARAWFLNFDAEAELADPSARTSSRAVEARARGLAERAVGLVAAGDVILCPGVRAEGLAGRAWCPTPRALAAIANAGASLPDAPPMEVLRRVNHRRFSAELGQTLPGARFVETRAELDATLAGSRARWLLKRPFGFAGRGRLRVTAGGLSATEERWIALSLAAGEGLQVEPWVERAGDFAIHGWVPREGAPVFGSVTWQRCDATGAWLSTDLAHEGDLSRAEQDALLEAAHGAGGALAAAGYFGPFGVDAYRHVLGSGAMGFNARSEINARYSMGWAVGMGELRPDL
jgi:hypothetical protein